LRIANCELRIGITHKFFKIVNLPSFLWLWKIAAWSMGLAIAAYFLLAIAGIGMRVLRLKNKPYPQGLREVHLAIGGVLVLLVLLLLSIGIIGTLGYYGSLGHSPHLIAGTLVVVLVLVSASSALAIGKWEKARSLHLMINTLLFFGFLFVSLSGWSVVQKYLP
jgi:ABC-type amino acid transport system permease subunit